MDWWKTQNPDKELFEKILSLNMYKETEELYEDTDAYNHPINIYTFGVVKYRDSDYRLATQGDIDKIQEPCFHIYEDDEGNYAHPEFDFVVSLIDLLSKDEINLIYQQDNKHGIKRTDRTECSWKGYEEIQFLVREYLSSTPKSNKRWAFNDNLDRAIYAWNNETCVDFEEKGINPLKEYCESHNISILEKYKPYFEKEI